MEEDRLSELSNDILHHILSFVDTREAFQKTILSTRWRDICRSLPDLRFNLSRPAFYNLFFFHFLLHRDHAALVRSLHLSFNKNFFLTPVEKSLLYAIDHGVQFVRIDGPNGLPTLRLPAALFTATTLLELKIRLLYSEIPVPGRFSLPNLKTLHLEGCLTFGDDVNMKEPFAGLRELEKLSLRGCLMTGLVLKAPKLRVLEIVDSCCDADEISAPLLTSFRYGGALLLECSKMNLPMLEQVYLDIHGITYNQVWLHPKCVSLFHQLRNATIVSVTLDTLKVPKSLSLSFA